MKDTTAINQEWITLRDNWINQFTTILDSVNAYHEGRKQLEDRLIEANSSEAKKDILAETENFINQNLNVLPDYQECVFNIIDEVKAFKKAHKVSTKELNEANPIDNEYWNYLFLEIEEHFNDDIKDIHPGQKKIKKVRGL